MKAYDVVLRLSYNYYTHLLLVLMLAFGAVAASKIRSQYFPDIVIESVNVSVSWPGAGADDLDTGVVELLEPVLLGLEGIESSSARSSEGSARISLSFAPGWDMVSDPRMGNDGDGPGGCGLPNPNYDFNDGILTTGADFWVKLVETELKDG